MRRCTKVIWTTECFRRSTVGHGEKGGKSCFREVHLKGSQHDVSRMDNAVYRSRLYLFFDLFHAVSDIPLRTLPSLSTMTIMGMERTAYRSDTSSVPFEHGW